MTQITQERLRELLHYDPETGVFRWRVGRRGRAKAGSVAGSKGKSGYIKIRVDGRYYRAHRLAWFWVHGEWPPEQIDHRNNIRDDNRWLNLRLATGSQNNANSPKRSSTSGYKGVHWDKSQRKWKAEIKKNRKNHHVGYFDDPVAAARAYDAKVIELFGEYARLNFPA